MPSRFDWLRRSQTGAELLATLQYLAAHPDLPADGGEIGPPPSALRGPCLRCWIYPRSAKKRHARYCPTCQSILDQAHKLGSVSRYSVVVWGFVNQLPRQLVSGGFHDSHVLDPYVHDENHFLLMLYQRELRPWLQELVIYNGDDLKGFIQVFPTTGAKDNGMGDLLCRIVQNEARFPMDRLRVRFFSDTRQIFTPGFYEREGVLTFEVAEFLNILEMASVFRSLLRPEEQENLYQVLKMGTTSEAQFYWGRFVGSLGPEARDMLNAWRLRQWSEPQINLLYELIEYVGFYQSH